MWNKSARLLMVRVKLQKHRNFVFPVPFWVVDEFFEALTEFGLGWGGNGIRSRWVKTFSPSGIIAASHSIIKDLNRYKGLDVVDVEVGEVQVKISIK